MKTILTILFIFVCFGLQAQVKEKWVDTDSTQTAKLSINESESVDSIINLDNVIFNDTLYFPLINWVIKPDSTYATDKNWNWIYNLGKP